MHKLYLLSSLLVLIVYSQNQCCLQIQGRICLSCPNGTHIYRGNCIIDVPNCQIYKDGFDCQTCLTGYNLNTNGDC
jgi:hypothetical protein